jgi:GR25 family glycosyltransferase involved in LPS biosynthesis
MKESKTEYSVVFEDDVKFKDNLNDEIIKITQKLKDLSIDFDILFLGNLVGNKGEPIIDNIFHMDKKNQCTGTHALLIKNKNIKKIFNVNCHVKGAIDNHYTACNKNNELICLVLSPSICYQYGFISNINI